MKPAVLAIALLSVGCGAEPAPTPVPVPQPAPAAIASEGSLAFELCGPGGSLCLFSGTARNTGTGCAENVRGVTKVVDAAGVQVGATAAWSYLSRVRAGETFVYRECCLSPGLAPVTYSTAISWDTVWC